MTAALLAGGGALLGGTSSLVGGKKGAQAATQAANVQAQAAMAAAALQQQRFEQAAQTLQPFISYGQQFMGPLQNLMGIGQPGGPTASVLGQMPGQWQPTMQQLANMPGYQFQLQQGLQAAQAQQAAAGLGRSGSATKAATQYASGLAAANWGQNWSQWLGQQQLNMAGQQQLYNMLAQPIGTGLGAAGAVAGVGVQTGAQIGNALQAAGAAQAGGITSAAQQQIGGFQQAAASLASAPYMYALTSQALGTQNPLAPQAPRPGVQGSYWSQWI